MVPAIIGTTFAAAVVIWLLAGYLKPHFVHAGPSGNDHDTTRYLQSMTRPFNPRNETAMQYLVWALEEIEKTGDETAARHVLDALDTLREASLTDNLERLGQ